MADLQRYFLKFHDNIKLRQYHENDTLRHKRDIIIDKLKDRLPAVIEKRGKKVPSFSFFDQGSYPVGTGTRPVDDDYDIDEGIVFDVCISDYPDPVELKEWVHEALNGHTDQVTIKRPCVTVQYHLDKEPIYHVDVAVYGHDRISPDSLYLARGKRSSTDEYRVWEPSDPKGLCDKINNRFAIDEEQLQFRRVIRYLKRWRDIKFSSSGNAAPVGIGITVAAYNWFYPASTYDAFLNTYKYIDVQALLSFVQTMLNNFVGLYKIDGTCVERLSVKMPVRPYDDPFLRMTDNQMQNFQDRLVELRDVLEKVSEDGIDPHQACSLLAKQFGDDFPVPPLEETAQRRGPAILSANDYA